MTDSTTETASENDGNTTYVVQGVYSSAGVPFGRIHEAKTSPTIIDENFWKSALGSYLLKTVHEPVRFRIARENTTEKFSPGPNYQITKSDQSKTRETSQHSSTKDTGKDDIQKKQTSLHNGAEASGKDEQRPIEVTPDTNSYIDAFVLSHPSEEDSSETHSSTYNQSSLGPDHNLIKDKQGENRKHNKEEHSSPSDSHLGLTFLTTMPIVVRNEVKNKTPNKGKNKTPTSDFINYYDIMRITIASTLKQSPVLSLQSGTPISLVVDDQEREKSINKNKSNKKDNEDTIGQLKKTILLHAYLYAGIQYFHHRLHYILSIHARCLVLANPLSGRHTEWRDAFSESCNKDYEKDGRWGKATKAIRYLTVEALKELVDGEKKKKHTDAEEIVFNTFFTAWRNMKYWLAEKGHWLGGLTAHPGAAMLFASTGFFYLIFLLLWIALPVLEVGEAWEPWLSALGWGLFALAGLCGTIYFLTALNLPRLEDEIEELAYEYTSQEMKKIVADLAQINLNVRSGNLVNESYFDETVKPSITTSENTPATFPCFCTPEQLKQIDNTLQVDARMRELTSAISEWQQHLTTQVASVREREQRLRRSIGTALGGLFVGIATFEFGEHFMEYGHLKEGADQASLYFWLLAGKGQVNSNAAPCYAGEAMHGACLTFQEKFHHHELQSAAILLAAAIIISVLAGVVAWRRPKNEAGAERAEG